MSTTKKIPEAEKTVEQLQKELEHKGREQFEKDAEEFNKLVRAASEKTSIGFVPHIEKVAQPDGSMREFWSLQPVRVSFDKKD